MTTYTIVALDAHRAIHHTVRRGVKSYALALQIVYHLTEKRKRRGLEAMEFEIREDAPDVKKRV